MDGGVGGGGLGGGGLGGGLVGKVVMLGRYVGKVGCVRGWGFSSTLGKVR